MLTTHINSHNLNNAFKRHQFGMLVATLKLHPSVDNSSSLIQSYHIISMRWTVFDLVRVVLGVRQLTSSSPQMRCLDVYREMNGRILTNKFALKHPIECQVQYVLRKGDSPYIPILMDEIGTLNTCLGRGLAFAGKQPVFSVPWSFRPCSKTINHEVGHTFLAGAHLQPLWLVWMSSWKSSPSTNGA